MGLSHLWLALKDFICQPVRSKSCSDGEAASLKLLLKKNKRTNTRERSLEYFRPLIPINLIKTPISGREPGKFSKTGKSLKFCFSPKMVLVTVNESQSASAMV